MNDFYKDLSPEEIKKLQEEALAHGDIFVDPNDKEVQSEIKKLQEEALTNGGMFVSDLVKKIKKGQH